MHFQKAVYTGKASDSIVEASGFFAISILLLLVCIGALAIENPIFFFAAVASVVVFSSKSPRLCIALLLSATIFQNLIVASVAQSIHSISIFRASQATNFVIYAALGSTFLVLLLVRQQTKQIYGNKTLSIISAYLVMISIYAIYGSSQSNVSSAIAYFRQFSVFAFALICGLYLGRRVDDRYLWSLITVVLCVVLTLAAFEILFPEEFYLFFGVDEFNRWKFQESIELHRADLIAESNKFSWLNLTGDYALNIEASKLLGPTLHNISFAYVISFLALVSLYRSKNVLFLASIALLVYVGAKGPLVISISASLMLILVRVSHVNQKKTEVITFFAAAVYTAMVIVYGILSIDLHVLGLLSGVSSVVSSPLGHGLGVGGNLSDAAREARNVAEYRMSGIPFAIESAFGVMLYQIGVFSALFLLMFKIVVASIRRVSHSDRKAVIFLASAYFLFCNTLFQEEALSPAAAGLYFFIFGFFISRFDKPLEQDGVWEIRQSLGSRA